MPADKVEIAVTFHEVPPGGNPWYDWSVVVDGVRASGDSQSQRGALHAARRRIRKIQRLRSTLDLPSLIDVESP